MKKNQYLGCCLILFWVIEEQFDLFCIYLDVCYFDGGMVDMDVFEFVVMVEEILICLCVIEYCDEESDDLMVVCLMDVFEDGVSMVYSFFVLELQKQSFGMFLIFDYIYIVCDVGLFYVYFGYWVFGSNKMDYKVCFLGFEIFIDGKW